MLFTSGAFIKFFAAFLLLFWLCRGTLKGRNWLILLSSFLFYAWWEPPGGAEFEGSNPMFETLWHLRFLGLLIVTALVDFGAGLLLDSQASPKKRKLILAMSMVANLGVLGFFKYSGFFVESLGAAFTSLGWAWERGGWNVVLPVGISFYTFQSMSYTIDVYRRQLEPTRDPVKFLAYISFFPQLVAGPIERAGRLLPQFSRKLTIDRATLEEGIWLILWGFFKKVVIADNMAPLAEMVFDSSNHTAATVIAGTIAFGIQIYCDFSGYSDIARGTARVLGFDLMWNFNLPYSASSVREFWGKWHISLSTWLRDYVYISLGGNREGKGRTYINLIVTMLLGGLWHGAGWNFILWGAWHGAALAANRAWAAAGLKLPKTAGWLLTMATVFYGWLLFRAASFEKITNMTQGLANFEAPQWFGSYILNLLFFTSPLILMELFQLRKRNLLAVLGLPGWVKAGIQGLLLIGIIIFWQQEKTPFIYFQF